MPGRYACTTTWDELSAMLDGPLVGDEDILRPRYNIAPTQPVATVVRDGDGYRVQEMHWGVRMGRSLLLVHNARDDKYLKPKRGPWTQYKRCAIPALGNYEWKGSGRRKSPMFIGLKNGKTLLFAGLYITQDFKDGTPPEKVVLVTTEPNEVVRPIHDRMGAILKPEHAARWLDPETLASDLFDVLAPYPADLMDAWRVGTGVNGPPRRDDPSMIARV